MVAGKRNPGGWGQAEGKKDGALGLYPIFYNVCFGFSSVFSVICLQDKRKDSSNLCTTAPVFLYSNCYVQADWPYKKYNKSPWPEGITTG